MLQTLLTKFERGISASSASSNWCDLTWSRWSASCSEPELGTWVTCPQLAQLWQTQINKPLVCLSIQQKIVFVCVSDILELLSVSVSQIFESLSVSVSVSGPPAQLGHSELNKSQLLNSWVSQHQSCQAEFQPFTASCKDVPSTQNCPNLYIISSLQQYCLRSSHQIETFGQKILSSHRCCQVSGWQWDDDDNTSEV